MTKMTTDEAEETPAEELSEEITDKISRLIKTLDDDQLLRLYIFELYADAEYNGNIMVQNMDLAYKWIKKATVPKDRSHLKSVSTETNDAT